LCIRVRYGASGRLVVRKIVQVYIDVVRLWVYLEGYAFNGGVSLQIGASHPVHSVQDAPVGREDDGMAQVGFLDQPDPRVATAADP